MADITLWNTADELNTLPPPDGFPEGQTRASLNNCSRAVMGAVRRLADDGGFFNPGYTVVYVSATEFQAQNQDFTSYFSVNRRVRANGTATGTIYGTITASVFSSPHTDCTVAWDSGALANETITITAGVDPRAIEAVFDGDLGTAAYKDFGIFVGALVELENVSGQIGLPAVDGSQLTNLPSSTDPNPVELLDRRSLTATPSFQYATAAWFSGNYSNLQFHIEHLNPAINGTTLYLQVSTNGGVSWLNGASDYTAIAQGVEGASGGGASFDTILTSNRIGLAGGIAAPSYGVTGILNVQAHDRTDNPTMVFGNFQWPYTINPPFVANTIWGQTATSAGINGIQIFAGSGTISGTISLWGSKAVA